MKGAIDEGKEISPMFPRLHVKDVEKGGPKAPPRNKMALYEQFSISSQSFASGSASLFPLPLRNCAVPSMSSHVSQVTFFEFFAYNHELHSLIYSLILIFIDGKEYTFVFSYHY